MAWAGDGNLEDILESGSSQEEEEEEEEGDEEAAPGQHPPLDPVPDDVEAQLVQLEEASQALLAELAALDTEVELEQRCRQRAQEFTAQVGTGQVPTSVPSWGQTAGTTLGARPAWGNPKSGILGFWDSGGAENARMERLSLARTPEVTPER
ncbi:hypothetical protein DUI87_22083 [Hirundo rustica rustica]|uniref:Shootin-1 n=1 Tax=Hirundo rustica rustica TaxID=333673 RepID=A0A3M0JKS1_HIRRU|nr:hypothetical protein DUI87_22083 [Hirundo rustica rustica]